MNYNMETFLNQEFGSVRIVQNGEKYLFCGTDIAKALGYVNPANAVTRFCKGFIVLVTPSAGGPQQTKFVSEGDVYRLIIRSKLPSAEQFEHWMFDELMPTIRKYGVYVEDSLLDDEDRLHSVLQKLKEERDRCDELNAVNRRLLPKAAYYDAILRSKNAVPITLIAKDYGMSATRFNRLLHALEVQYKVCGCWLLYQQYAEQGFTITHTYHVGENQSTMHTCWTQKGRLFLYELLMEHGIYPVAERTE